MEEGTQEVQNTENKGASLSDVVQSDAHAHVEQVKEEFLRDEPKQEEVKQESVLPDKFKSVDDLVKAYSELEKRIGEKPVEETKAEEKTDEPVHQTIPGVNDSDLTRYDSEFNENGKLSDKSYQELESAGYPKHVVDAFIEGNKARASKMTEEIGGMDKFNEMKSWAKQSMDKSEQQRINTLLSSNDEYYVKLGLNQLKSAYENKNGKDPKLVSGARPVSGPTDVFESNTQVIRAMQDPKYQTDPAYRKSVQEKLMRSKNLL